MKRALVLLALALVACPPSSPATSATTDASDAALVGDSAPSSACSLLCANLTIVGCHPLEACAVDCTFATSKHLVDGTQMACATSATSADAVRACGGRWCR